jgi:hypothetical protein
MKLAVMQPYFFPYIGYFDLLSNVDLFIIYDTVQYIKQGWINRNRILRPNKVGWQYVTVPLNRSSFHSSYKTSIMDVQITSNGPWKEHIIAQLEHYKKKAPYAADTIEFVEAALQIDEDSISRLNVHLLKQCAQLLKLDFHYAFCSDLDVKSKLDTIDDPEDRVLALCQWLGAKEYVNLPGGMDLYEHKSFVDRNIKLTFRRLPAFIYSTEPYSFEPNLSIIDVLMWNNPEDIKNYLDTYRSQG